MMKKILFVLCVNFLLDFYSQAKDHGFLEDSEINITAKNNYINIDNREFKRNSG